jgi:hypothetical protein
MKSADVGGDKTVSKRTFHTESEDDLDFDSFDVETLRAYARHARKKQRALIGYYEMCTAGSAGDFANEVMFDLDEEEFKETFGIERTDNDSMETLRALVYSAFEPPTKKIKITAESDETENTGVSK